MVNNSETTASYHDLTPDLILDAVDSLGFRTDGRLLALNSYENRVYQKLNSLSSAVRPNCNTPSRCRSGRSPSRLTRSWSPSIRSAAAA